MANMTCFRGEKENRWGSAALRLNDGLTVRKPWTGGMLPDINAQQVWARLMQDIKQQANDDVNAYAQYLRATGRDFALATARIFDGSFEDDFNYEMAVPSARTFLWEKKSGVWVVGSEVPWVESTKDITNHYIVLNAATPAASTVLGFGHKTGTFEVTFLTDVRTSWLEKVNKAPVSEVRVKPKKDFTAEERILMRDLVRPPGKF
ncbi:hypothetical protein OG528_28940 [Streptomyces platensis]|uniref:hypothetical protein n=1 Tax=Streptomyces TaxID=1883 RepID=UPI00225355D0|nr:hypothetical protein [Streptomyces platensis]MCX4635167.1 hypothetical protein [Streptomyces platensis]